MLGSAELKNCLSVGKELRIRCDQGPVELTNCYGKFGSGHATTQADWDYQTNYITSSPSVHSESYRITDSENVWKNVGTGNDPDGSIADLGVYGGEYSW